MQQILGFLNSTPTEVIDQFAGNPPQQNWIGVAQELEHHPPLAFFFARSPAAADKPSNAVFSRRCSMWLATRSAMVSISLRSSFRKGPRRPGHLPPGRRPPRCQVSPPAPRSLRPGSRAWIRNRRAGFLALEIDSCLAVVRVLPTRRQHLDHPPEDIFQ